MALSRCPVPDSNSKFGYILVPGTQRIKSVSRYHMLDNSAVGLLLRSIHAFNR